jgi:hypothetical protein
MPDMASVSFGAAGYWIYNARKFSLRAAFIQNERQKLFRERAFLSGVNLSALEKRLWLRGFAIPLKKTLEVLPAFALD